MSVSLPDFCTASLSRESLFIGVVFQSIDHERVTACAGGEIARNPTDGGDAHASDALYFTVREAFAEAFDDGPSVGHSLELGGCAEVDKKGAQLVRRAACEHRVDEIPLDFGLVSRREVAV